MPYDVSWVDFLYWPLPTQSLPSNRSHALPCHNRDQHRPIRPLSADNASAPDDCNNKRYRPLLYPSAPPQNIQHGVKFIREVDVHDIGISIVVPPATGPAKCLQQPVCHLIPVTAGFEIRRYYCDHLNLNSVACMGSRNLKYSLSAGQADSIS